MMPDLPCDEILPARIVFPKPLILPICRRCILAASENPAVLRRSFEARRIACAFFAPLVARTRPNRAADEGERGACARIRVGRRALGPRHENAVTFSEGVLV